MPVLASMCVLAAVAAEAAGLSRAEITAEYGPTAPEKIVRDLQVRTDRDAFILFTQALPEAMRGKPFELAVDPASGGVTVRLAIEGSSSDAKMVAQAMMVPLEDLVHEVGGDYSAKVTVKAPGFEMPGLGMPNFSLPKLPDLPAMPALPADGAAKAVGGAVLAGGGALLVVFLIRRGFKGPKRLPLPTLWGSPVLGLLPESLARVGKLYHLQSKPCQAMGYFFMQQAHAVRKVAISSPTPEAGGTVAVTLGLFLVREGQKVLLVDLSGETNVVPAILSRFGTPPEEQAETGAHGTSIPDLDLMTMNRSDGTLPDLPPEIADGYQRILYVMPPGFRPRAIPCIDVVLKPSLKAALASVLGAPRVGWVFFGDGVPMRVSDRYYTRYYYEKLHEVSVT
ncbi:MAG: hypothetical protein FJZ00_09255 [Candidatus Sericytochromatia bacterium]|uniref:Uncharacterized protein n=1 Tax=Candidatus Tanganyikabacteria bacterium TaxID=2961651 RepID=A0A938BNF2_9BACT|nr:hypothetical protein [Candidatus Tanganyikabacteria bacterium]